MTEQIDFYLLGNADSATRYKYACRIANKAYGQKMTVYMQTDTEEQSLYLDKLLWTFSQESFVPHTVREFDTDWIRYPVQIGSQHSRSSEVDLLISLKQEAPEDYDRYRRIADLIIDEPQEKQLGRQRFRFYREKGIEPKTHNI